MKNIFDLFFFPHQKCSKQEQYLNQQRGCDAPVCWTKLHTITRIWTLAPNKLMILSQFSLFVFVKQVKNILKTKTGLSIQVNLNVNKKEGMSRCLLSISKLSYGFDDFGLNQQTY